MGVSSAREKVSSDLCARVFHQPGQSGKTVPELEKRVGLMKKVVEKVQRENETLKNSSRPASQAKVASLQQENLRLKVEHAPRTPTPLPLPRGSISCSLSPPERE